MILTPATDRSEYVAINGRTVAVVTHNRNGTYTACANPRARSTNWDRTSSDKIEAIQTALAACPS
jgi:hypothetical protein